MLLRHDRNLPTVQELQQQQEHLISNWIHWNNLRIACPGRRTRWRQPGPNRVEARRGIWAAEELAEEERAGGKDAAVGMDYAALDAEGDVWEGLAVDQEVEIVQREGLEGVFQVHGLGF